MPRRRKGTKYVHSLAVLLRDAEPLHSEIEGEPDKDKRRERKRARDFARGELFKMYRDVEECGNLHTLDIAVRMFCEQEIARNGGVLPKSPGGRPTKEHERLLVAVHVLESIAVLGKRRGKVELALRETADRFGLAYDHVRDIFYDRDPNWRRALKAEMAWRKLPSHEGELFKAHLKRFRDAQKRGTVHVMEDFGAGVVLDFGEG